MKKLIVVAYQEFTGHQYAQTIQGLFGDALEVTFYSMYSDHFKNLDADIVLASTYTVCELVKQYVPNFDNIIIADITLRKESVEQLRAFPAGTSAALFNISLENAIDTISLIYKCGVSNLDLKPVYPPIPEDFRCDLAVTPGEPELVPPGVKRIIDLGDRILSMKTITEIAIRLGLSDLLRTPAFRGYFDELVATDVSVNEMLHQINFLEQQLQILFQVFGSGVMSVNTQGGITYVNEQAAQLLGRERPQMVGKALQTVLPGIWEAGGPTEVKDRVLTVPPNVLIASVRPIRYASALQGYIVLLKEFTDLEREQLKIRRQVMARGHAAKYTFDDIVGNSPVLLQAKELARKIARSNSSVLIYGQTGTGKELFAQSIHNASPRREGPFLAINCAAIPENLLESELFGYEEGAFTGARKGGKTGFFEQAHGGTLFLDEISEMNIMLQTRLLRVLQEREITRIGGDTVINTDVRIIAASNKKLKELVNQSAFRQDLYYRLNVFGLHIPPLESRKEDIPLLIESMKCEMHAGFTLTPCALALIQGLRFEGNVRELRNLMERLLYAETTVIDAEEVRRYLDEEIPPEREASREDAAQIERFLWQNAARGEALGAVLEALGDTCHGRRRMGRKTLQLTLGQRGGYYSEQEIRTLMGVLQDYRLISVLRGRGGSAITELGMKALQAIKQKGWTDDDKTGNESGFSGACMH